MAKMANFVDVSLRGRKKAVLPCVLGPTFSKIAKNEQMMKSVAFWDKRRFLAKMTVLDNIQFQGRKKAVFTYVFVSTFSEITKNENVEKNHFFRDPGICKVREPVLGPPRPPPSSPPLGGGPDGFPYLANFGVRKK